ncbi:hypothetical protein [Streptomyces sp. NRRL S-340]|nr:hypothetical protein [Streptomyces sp. NRRL S-340]
MSDPGGFDSPHDPDGPYDPDSSYDSYDSCGSDGVSRSRSAA